ncbi:hypothetical protein GGF32_005020 [Allomyces javanicus]|nr:hypothetical protein GGF32_005020 [Allomyces javanicus]
MSAAAMLAQSRAIRSRALKLILNQATTTVKNACTTGADSVRATLAVLDGSDTTSHPAIPALLADMEAALRALGAKYDAQVLAAVARLDEDVRAADNLHQYGPRSDAGPAIAPPPAPGRSDGGATVAAAAEENDPRRADDEDAPAPRPNATRSRAKAAKMRPPSRGPLALTPESPAPDRDPARRRDPAAVTESRNAPRPQPPRPPPAAALDQPGKRRFDQVATGAAKSSDSDKRRRISSPDPPPPPSPPDADANREEQRVLARREKNRLKKLRKQEKKRAAAAAALGVPDPAGRDELDAPDPADPDDADNGDVAVEVKPPPSQERRVSRRLSMVRAREADQSRTYAPPSPPPPPPPSPLTMRRRSMTRAPTAAELDSPRPRRLSRSTRPDSDASATAPSSSSTSPAALLPFDPLTPALRAQLAADPYGRGMLGTPFILTRTRRDAVPLQTLRTALGLPAMGAGPAWNNHLMLQAGVTKQNERYCISCGHAPYSAGHVCCEKWEVGAFRKGSVVFGLRRAVAGTGG